MTRAARRRRPDALSELRSELVVSRGRARQAGTVDPVASFVPQACAMLERSLYAFGRVVFGFDRLTESLHLPVCDWMQTCPPRRKFLAMPRDHLKTTIVGQALPAHILVQPRENNLYFPGCLNIACIASRRHTGVTCTDLTHYRDGCDTRILYGYETQVNARTRLRWLESQWERNEILRALWPHRVWDSARAESNAWSQDQMTIPRNFETSEPTVRAIGVDGAIAGAHHHVHIFDDLATLEAANSTIVMRRTIEWFVASRSLADDPVRLLEFQAGTKWAIHDVIAHCQKDPTIEMVLRKVVENGEPIWPEMFTPEVIEEKRRQYGSLFTLLYMNSAADPSLIYFPPELLRDYVIEHDSLAFTQDIRDAEIARRSAPQQPITPSIPVGVPLETALDMMERAYGRDAFLQMRYGRTHAG